MELSGQARAQAATGFIAADPRADIEANARNVIMKTRASFAHAIPAGRFGEPDCGHSRAGHSRRTLRVR